MATKLNMKIHGYDESTHSLIVSFSTDDSIKTVEEYQRLAFQPSSIAGTPEETLKKIAERGLKTAKLQDMKDNEKSDDEIVNTYKSLVGQTLVYNVEDITPPPPDSNLTDMVNL